MDITGQHFLKTQSKGKPMKSPKISYGSIKRIINEAWLKAAIGEK